MTKRRFCVTFFLLICFSLPLTGTAQTVNIPDDKLRDAIWNDLGYLPFGPIPASDMAKLKVLTARNRNITDLTGLEAATNLTQLNLDNNRISDISALENLTNLTSLSLSGNSISDISPLVANTGLGNGDTVDVTDNPLNDASINTHIPVLQSRGVTVEFSVNIPDDNLLNNIWHELGYLPDDTVPASKMVTLTKLTARNRNITDLTGLEYATNLTQLNLENNSISDISPLAGLSNLEWLWLEANNISDISPLVANTGLGDGDFVDVSENPLNDASINTHLTALQHRGVTVEFGEPVAIPDDNLRDAIWNELGFLPSGPIAASLMTGLTQLEASNANITDLTGLEYATNLTQLNLENNSISDISPLVANTGLGNGDTVTVSENPLNDASINTHIPALRSRGVEVRADNLKPTTSEYTLTMPAGISLIHVPLKVTAINRSPGTIESISELYDVRRCGSRQLPHHLRLTRSGVAQLFRRLGQGWAR